MVSKINILNLKILFGYLIMLLVIIGVISIILCEKRQLHEIRADVVGHRNIRYDIHLAHRFITELATLGEAVVGWENEDYQVYCEKRLCTDSLLQKLQQNCLDFIDPEHINTLRSLLASKERHLYHIMQTLHKQGEADSLLVHGLPLVGDGIHSREVRRRKKGIAGWFGKKELIQVASPAKTLYFLNEQLRDIQKVRRNELESYTDTLRAKNRILNSELVSLISKMDTLTQMAFERKEQRIENMRLDSFRLMSYMLLVAILSLFISYLVIQRDLRQKEKSRLALEESIRQNKTLLDMRKKIILTISHDIRGPLGSINGSAELAMDTREKKKRNNHLVNIQISCRHILHLVNNLLDIYRMNENKESRNEIPFKLDKFLERIITEYLHECNNKGILFITELSGIEIMTVGDVDRIEQILDNLLTNAIKFTEVGEIRFLVSYGNGLLIIEVRDTGIGMSEETLSRIFLPFERAAQNVNSEGFGLGLSITKGLVGLLGGNISVRSSIGKGSVFRVELPLVETQENVKEVVKALRKRNFDLILTDVQMPDKDGFNLFKLIRNSKIGNSQTVPIMAMTAHGDKSPSVFTEAGFFDCINKPFSAHELLSFISSAVRQENEEMNEVSFEVLTSETDDKETLLELFVGESARSISEFRDALETMNRKRLREIVHRMLPLWKMLRVDNILHKYYKILHDKHASVKTVEEETDKIVACTSELMVKAENEITRLKNETENTDS